MYVYSTEIQQYYSSIYLANKIVLYVIYVSINATIGRHSCDYRKVLKIPAIPHSHRLLRISLSSEVHSNFHKSRYKIILADISTQAMIKYMGENSIKSIVSRRSGFPSPYSCINGNIYVQMMCESCQQHKQTFL